MRALGLIMLGVLLAGCAGTTLDLPDATVELKTLRGETVGSARLWETRDGVRLVAAVRDLPPGPHGIHLHAAGRCDPPDFTSAGGHFNPGNRQHGLENPRGPHAGDMPNIQVGADGSGRLEYAAPAATLGPGPMSLFDSDGTALVVHAGPDDQRSDPAGNSGGRIACGVVRKS
jgi:Cu-Zn family superoxide dismutase